MTQDNQTQAPAEAPPAIDNGRVVVKGKEYLADAKGGLVPIELIKPQHLLQDELVRKIMGYAGELSGQVSRFKQHTFDDIGAFEAILEQEYAARIGGAKGNKTLMTHDGLMKVSVAVADYIDFGPEIQTAKALIDECLNEWSGEARPELKAIVTLRGGRVLLTLGEARPELKAIVTRAFNTDKPGQINRAEVFMLLRLEIEDERWQRAMAALRDAMRIVGSKTYVRCYRRPAYDAPWEPVSIDLAKA